MKTKIYLLVLFLSTQSFAQEILEEDYILLNEVAKCLLTFNGKDVLVIYERPYPFENKDSFFTKEVFNEYLYLPLKSKKKIKKMIQTLDFKYLVTHNRTDSDWAWDFKRVESNIVKYSGKQEDIDGMERYGISKPVYTRDRELAFIYYYKTCGRFNCGSWMLLIFKKCNEKWSFYEHLPMAIY